MLEKGIIPSVRVGRRWIVTRHAYEHWERTCGMRLCDWTYSPTRGNGVELMPVYKHKNRSGAQRWGYQFVSPAHPERIAVGFPSRGSKRKLKLRTRKPPDASTKFRSWSSRKRALVFPHCHQRNSWRDRRGVLRAARGSETGSRRPSNGYHEQAAYIDPGTAGDADKST